MHAYIKWVCSFKGTASDTSKSVHLSQEWNYIQTMAKYYVFRLLVCDVYVLVQ